MLLLLASGVSRVCFVGLEIREEEAWEYY